jgi:60 kDa SS-A/Ro ribonucleoprotein
VVDRSRPQDRFHRPKEVFDHPQLFIGQGDELGRISHPKAPSREHDAVFRWALRGVELGERTITRKVKGEPRPVTYQAAGELPALVQAFEQAKKAESRAEIVSLIADYNLPREAIPTQWLNELPVWEALLPRMPMTAMVRNLGKMTALGLVQPFSEAAVAIQRKLGDETALKRARIHPMAVLLALKVYAQGRGEKGKLTWKPVTKIVDALDQAFYASFANVEPCGS